MGFGFGRLSVWETFFFLFLKGVSVFVFCMLGLGN